MAHASIFLKLDGIPGPSIEADHKGELELTDANLGAASVNDMELLHCTAPDSIASPKLWKAFLEKAAIKQAILTCRVSGSDKLEYSTMTFSDCRVAAYGINIAERGNKTGSTNGTSGGRAPIGVIHFSLAFAKFEAQIKEIKTDGTLGSPVKYGFDFNTGRSV